MTPVLPVSSLKAAILTGCQDRPYAFGLSMALVSEGVSVNLIGGDEVDSPELHTTPNLQFLNFRGEHRQDVRGIQKAWRLLVYYARLIAYCGRREPSLFHILWNNKFEYFDRTLLMLYYKMTGKKVTLTAHNINQGKRDSNDSFLNRVTLRIQYRLADHIFVHTKKMKTELTSDFGVPESAVTVIRHPINNAFPDTALTPAEAKAALHLEKDEKVILFFGRLRPYKGLEHLLEGVKWLLSRDSKYRLIIAGEPKKGSEDYSQEIQTIIKRDFQPGQVFAHLRFIADDEMETFLKAADVLVLPYKDIFQSGVLFLSYSFGLPVVATDVGSFREEIIEGKTGFICKPDDPADLAITLERYFRSDLYRELGCRREKIREYAHAHHSWHAVAELTRNVYSTLLTRQAA
jgi:D-inositol-3-phosphate glycosyltransferase